MACCTPHHAWWLTRLKLSKRHASEDGWRAYLGDAALHDEEVGVVDVQGHRVEEVLNPPAMQSQKAHAASPVREAKEKATGRPV